MNDELRLVIAALKRVSDRYSHGGATERTIGKALSEVAQEITILSKEGSRIEEGTN